MKYWDGARWTGDTRPGRRPFAAASAHRGWGIALAVFGVLSVVTSPSQLQPDAADTLSSTSPVSDFLVAVVLGIALAAWGVYLLRGQRPSTKAVEARLAAESAATNLRQAVRPRSQPQSVVVNVGAPGAGDAAAVAQISALASPETAKALQNLQNLLYTHVLTDAEFQAAKDKLLGDTSRSHVGTPAGWYDDGSGRQRWWDGQQWTEHVQGNDYADGVRPLIAVDAEIVGRPAMVWVFSDRVEWVTKGAISPGKITAGVLTGGLSLAVTGVGKGGYGPGGNASGETIRMSAITRVASAKSGGRSVVSVSTPGGVLPVSLAYHDAQRLTQALNVLVASAAREAAGAAPIVVQVTTPTSVPSPAASSPVAGVDTTAQISKLAELHASGVLTAAEFAAAKARALGL